MSEVMCNAMVCLNAVFLRLVPLHLFFCFTLSNLLFLWQKLHCLYLRFLFLFSLCCCCVEPQLTRTTLVWDNRAVISAAWISLSAATHGNMSRCWSRFVFITCLVFIQICFIYVFCFTLRTIEVSQRSANVTPRIAQVGHARFVPLRGSHCSSSLFPLRVPFFTSRTEVPSPESLHCRPFFSAEELLGRGDKFVHHPSFGFRNFFRSPAPVCRVFCLALQAYQVRSGALCRESFFSPTDGFRRPDVCEPMPGRCRDYALLSFIPPLIPIPPRLFQFVPWAQCFLKPPPH